jgi:hypothetical protein
MSFESGEVISKALKKRNLLKYLGIGAVAGGVGLFSKQKAEAATNTYAFVHGLSVWVERPDLTTSIYRQGFATTIQGQPNTNNLFHFAIPTVVPSTNVRLTGGIVNFTTGSSNVVVKSLGLYIFTERVAAIDNLNLYGANQGGYLPVNPPRYPGAAVTLSVGVSFGSGSAGYVQFFQAAGIFDNIV